MREMLAPLLLGMVAAMWLGGVVVAFEHNRPQLAMLAAVGFMITIIGALVWAQYAGAEDAEREFRSGRG